MKAVIRSIVAVLLLTAVCSATAAAVAAAAGFRAPRNSPADSVSTLVTKDGLDTVEVALKLYRKEYGEYPETLEEILIKKGIAERDVIEDGWGREYRYIKMGESYELFSMGRDGRPYTNDDIYPDDA